jgi:hypothetical protein
MSLYTKADCCLPSHCCAHEQGWVKRMTALTCEEPAASSVHVSDTASCAAAVGGSVTLQASWCG